MMPLPLKRFLTVAVATALCGAVQAATVLKISHNQSTDVPVHKAMKVFADKVQEYTDGEVKVRIYPNAQLG